jgi:hypothetical protein
MIVDGMADSDMGQVNSIPNQYGVYLDLIFFNSPLMLGVSEAKTLLLKTGTIHYCFNIRY